MGDNTHVLGTRSRIISDCANTFCLSLNQELHFLQLLASVRESLADGGRGRGRAAGEKGKSSRGTSKKMTSGGTAEGIQLDVLMFPTKLSTFCTARSLRTRL